MNKLLMIALAASAALVSTVPAQARDGCGPGFHRGPYGACHPNGGPVVVGVAGPRIGVFYGGHGYWDGHRYWGHRFYRHGRWVYN